MSYRNIVLPPGARSFSQSDWIDWAVDERLFLSVAPKLSPECRLCFGAVGLDSVGTPYSFCQHCWNYRTILGVVPILYSVDEGLESLLHMYKDDKPPRKWMSIPLASVLDDFLKEHLDCVQSMYGKIDIATTVPNSSATRDFNHVDLVVEQMPHPRVPWDLTIVRKSPGPRPERGVIESSSFLVNPFSKIEDKTVLLLDDTWTSGSTIASVAKTLLLAGALRVVALPIGRQLHAGWGQAATLIRDATARGYSNTRCVICG